MKTGRPKLPARERGGKACLYLTAEARGDLARKRRVARLGLSAAVAAAVAAWRPEAPAKSPRKAKSPDKSQIPT